MVTSLAALPEGNGPYRLVQISFKQLRITRMSQQIAQVSHQIILSSIKVVILSIIQEIVPTSIKIIPCRSGRFFSQKSNNFPMDKTNPNDYYQALDYLKNY